MARTRAMSPAARAPSKRPHRPWSRYDPAEYAAAPPAAQTRKTPAKTTQSATKTVKRRSGLADDRASTATGGNANLRAKVLAAVLRLSRERNRGEAGIGHSSIRSYLLKHGENPKAKGTAERIRRIKLDLMDQGVLVKGWSPGSTIAVRKGIDTQVNKLCDVQDPDSSDDERACSAYLASRLDRSRPSTRSCSKARSRAASKKTVKKRRTHADVDDTDTASDETDYDAPPRPAHYGTGKGKQPAPAATQRKRSSKKVRVAEPKHDEEGSDGEVIDAGGNEDGPRTRSKGKKVVKRAASGKGSAGARGGTSRLTKAQLVAQVEELRRKEDEREDEVEDLREKLTEMSEVNQTWEARARVLGYRDENEELGVGEVEEEEDAQQPAPEQDVRVEEEPDSADEGAQELNAAPVVEEPDEQDLGGMDQQFFADDVDLDAELERAGWPQPPQPPAQEQRGQAPSTAPFAVSPSAARPFAGAPYFPEADASRARGTSAPPRVTDLPSTASARTADDPAGFDDEYPRLSSDNEDGPTRSTGAIPVKGKGRMLQDASPSSSPAAGRFLSVQLNPHSPSVDLPAQNVASSSSPAKSEAGHLSRFGGYGARATTSSQPSSPLGTSPPPTVRGDPYRRVVELEREVAKEREREQMLKEDMEGILRRHHEVVEELAAENLRLEGTVPALRHKRAAGDAASTARLIPALKVDAPVNLVSQAVQTPPLLDPSAQLTASALRIAELEGDLARTTTRASELDKKLEESEAAYDALLESDRAKQEQAKLDMRKIATLESALAKEQGEREKERAARARAKDETKASLEARLKEVKAAHDKLAFDLSRVRSALAAAEADRDLQVKNADVAHEEKGAALAARDRIAGDVVKIKNELELAKQEIRRRNEELTSAAAQIQQLEAQLSRAEEHTQPDQRAVTAYTHDVAELQGRIEDLEALKRDADRKAQADADLEEMRSELGDLRSRLNDVEGDRTEAERGRAAAECKVLELERGVETAGASVSAMVTEKAALAAELAEIKVRLESIVTEKMTVESRIIEHAVKAGFLAGPATAHSPSHAELVELLESLMLRLHSREDVVKRLGDERDQQADLLKSLLRRANELLAERTVTDPSTSGTLGSEAQTDVETALKLVGGKLASLEVQLEQTSAWKADAEARALVIKDAAQTLVELEAVLSAAIEAETPDSAPVQQDLLAQVKRATILAIETASRLKRAHEALAAAEAQVAAEEAKVAAMAVELAQAEEEIKSKDVTIADAQASLQASFAENERLGSRMSVFKRFCDAFWEEDAARAEGVGGSSVSQTASGPAGGAGELAH
ncbi:hypothetical protein JCM10449v2_003733 [Rhodotorula kratochvilovae]